MTDLNKSVRRVTSAKRHEKSRTRALILSLDPPAQVGVRLQGTRQTYRLDAESVYEMAVLQHQRRIDRRARQIAKSENLKLRQAMVKARKELQEELR